MLNNNFRLNVIMTVSGLLNINTNVASLLRYIRRWPTVLFFHSCLSSAGILGMRHHAKE